MGLTDGLKSGIESLMESALLGFDDSLNAAWKYLAEQNDGVWDTVLDLSDALKPFCYIVIALCLLIEIAQVAMKVDMVKWEHGLKLGCKMVIAKLCIEIAPKFLKACYLQACIWIGGLSNGVNLGSYGGGMLDTLREHLADVKGLGTVLGLFLTTVIVVLAIKVCGLLVQVIAFGRMFELYVYLAISPLPCAFAPLGDGSGGGISTITKKFFKSFISICLQGVLMVLCIRIFGNILGSAFNEMSKAAELAGSASAIVSELSYTMLMASLVLIMSISRCGNWAHRIMDSIV